MKTNGEEKKVQAISYDIPVSLHKALSESAKKNKWTIKKELIQALEEYLDGSFVKLDPSIKKAVAIYAETNDFTITEATNYLVSTKLSVFEEVSEIIKIRANKDYEAALSDDLEKTMTGT